MSSPELNLVKSKNDNETKEKLPVVRPERNILKPLDWYVVNPTEKEIQYLQQMDIELVPYQKSIHLAQSDYVQYYLVKLPVNYKWIGVNVGKIKHKYIVDNDGIAVVHVVGSVTEMYNDTMVTFTNINGPIKIIENFEEINTIYIFKVLRNLLEIWEREINR